MKMTAIQPESWKEDYRQFEQATEQFYSGEMDPKLIRAFRAVSEAMLKRAERPACFVCVCRAV